MQIKGKAKVGRTLSVSLHRGSWSAGARFTYQWRVYGKVVGTGATLRLWAKLAGKQVTVRVTGTRGDWSPTFVLARRSESRADRGSRTTDDASEQ